MIQLPDSSPRAVLIAGPTASGKSALGLEIAQQLNGVIVNADALQVYADWHIITARPDATDLTICDHHLYGHVGLSDPYSVGHWLDQVQNLLHKTDRTPIIIGGTGLYFKALTQGLSNIPRSSPHTLAASKSAEDKHGVAFFADQLRSHDPETFAKIDSNNPARTRRAWEVLHETGQGLAAWHAKTPPPLLPLGEVTALNLVSDTDWLNARINKRFDQMIDMGALEECRAVMDRFDPSLPSCKAIGAAELIAHLRGDLDLTDAIEDAKLQTRQYAKRQRTWFRSNMKSWHQVTRGTDGWVLD